MLPFGLQSSLINRGAQALGGLFGLKPKAPPLPGQLAAIQPPAPNTFSRPPQYDRAPIQAPQRPVYGPPKPLPNAPTGGMTFKPGTAIPTGTIKPGAPSRPVVSPTGTPPAGSPTGGQTGGQTAPPPQQPAPQQPPAFNTAAQIAALTGKQYASGQNIVADGRMQSEVQINPGEREIPLAQAQAMGLIGPASSGSTQPWKVTVEGDQVKVYQPHGVSQFGLPADSPLRSQIAAMGGGTPVNAPPTLASQGTFLSPNQLTPVNAQVQALGIPAGAAQSGATQPPGVPAGATLITGPSGLQGLTESQIYRDLNSKNIYKLPTAGAAGTTPAPGTTTPPPAGTTGTAGAGTTTEANPFAQTPEELKAQQQLDAIIASEKLGSVNIEDQTIPMDFITGQQAALERRAAALSEPLKTKLANEQAKRQAALDYSKFQADQAKARAEETKPFQVGEDTYKFNPATQTYEKAPGSVKPVSLAAGATLVDPVTGKVIASGPQKDIVVGKNSTIFDPNTGQAVRGAAPAGSKVSTSSGSVAVGKDGLATGPVAALAEAVLNGQLAMSQVRKGLGKGPTQYDQVQAEVLKRDPEFDFINNEASAKFRENVKNQQLQASAKNAIETAKIATTLSNQIPRSKLTYANGVVMAVGSATSDPKVVQFTTTINALGDEIGTVLGGGSATDYKAKLGSIMANPNLSQEAFAAQMGQVIQLFQNRINAQLAQGNTPTSSSKPAQVRQDNPALSLTALAGTFGISPDRIQALIRAGHTAADVRAAILAGAN